MKSAAGAALAAHGELLLGIRLMGGSGGCAAAMREVTYLSQVGCPFAG